LPADRSTAKIYTYKQSVRVGLSIGAHSRDDHRDAKPGEGEESSERELHNKHTKKKQRRGHE
jgi:hypothetical protein